jgi:6-phosphogluconate dehydrogenase
MNAELAKVKINSERFKFLREVAKLSQQEVSRCYAEIDSAETQAELDSVKFVAPKL